MSNEHRERLVIKLEKTGAAIVSSSPDVWQSLNQTYHWKRPGMQPLYVLYSGLEANHSETKSTKFYLDKVDRHVEQYNGELELERVWNA